ncbi:MAG: HAD family hydrolase [Dehalobacterium sp.]
MKFKGIIFDLDGTLINSLEDIADSMNRVLSRKNFPIHDSECYKYFIGNGIKNMVIEALPEKHRHEEVVTNCFNLMMEDYRNNCLVKTRLYDGIPDLLNILEKRNIKIAVFSNKADNLTKMIVKELLNNWCFDTIIGASSDIPRKPDPTGACLISKALGICPDNMIYVGDSDVDMNTANSAGMFAIGVMWGYRTQHELLANGAKMLLKHPLDLIDFLEKDNEV